MAFYQNSVGKRQVTPPTPFQAGDVMSADFDVDVSAGFVAASDKYEIGLLPAGCKIVDYLIIPTSMNGNATIGFMSGEPGAVDAARTVGAEFASALTLASTMIRATAFAAGLATPNVAHRGIGFTNSADVVAGAGKGFTLRVWYTMP